MQSGLCQLECMKVSCLIWPYPCADPESFVRGEEGGGATLTKFGFVLFDEGRDDPNITKSGPLSARQRNAIKVGYHRPASAI